MSSRAADTEPHLQQHPVQRCPTARHRIFHGSVVLRRSRNLHKKGCCVARHSQRGAALQASAAAGAEPLSLLLLVVSAAFGFFASWSSERAVKERKRPIRTLGLFDRIEATESSQRPESCEARAFVKLPTKCGGAARQRVNSNTPRMPSAMEPDVNAQHSTRTRCNQGFSAGTR